MPAGGSAAVPTPPPSPVATTCPACQAPNVADALFCEACGYDFTTGTMPRRDPVPAPGPVAASASLAPALEGWVAEVWVDPDWYADQESTDPLPSPGLPTVVQLATTSVLIGRASRSRNISPDIDLASDNGISRRHAQLTTDGTRWWVEDLGSSNGTYVGSSVGALPTVPVVPGQKQEVGPDDRIYLGAWTRIILRRAAPGELPA
ncbi:MAG: FHA domain-containing protein [Actinobacteria bacterium]|nr:FHA domain-containing protein [Actinomycetota bacterium]